MQDPVVYPDTPAMKVVQLILHGHTSVPVVDRETGRLEGIISSWNVLEILMRERA
ncbi:MAG: CBS domain-containing protein [Candidatus Competibacteraceae bacterium]|nr:CBS domain-containing protein [Candidatus Competibacteraceae bacterium]